MKLSQLFSPFGIAPKNDIEITGLRNNSKRVEPGDLFIAIKGYAFDGAQFIPEAIKNGAVAIVAHADNKAIAAQYQGIEFAFLDMDMRQAESELAKIFYPSEPSFIAAATGTNGKSSVVNFVRQLFELSGTPAASIGTVGIKSEVFTEGKGLTTPDAIELRKNLSRLKSLGVEKVAIETSSHGLEQHRVDSLKIAAAGFTNLSNDHLDYYDNDIEKYFSAKLILFSKLLDSSGTAVVNIDDPYGVRVAETVRARGVKILSYGHCADCDLRLEKYEIKNTRQEVAVNILGKKYDLTLNLISEFQVMNLLCAIGMFIVGGGDFARIADKLDTLKNEAGRLEYVASTPNGAPIYVDFGHNGDGVKKLLTEFRPYVKHNLILIIGSSGDRPEIRRTEIGKVIGGLADTVIITDDNPRTEDPAKIRASLLAHCPRAIEIPNRYEAINETIDTSREWDSIIICGTMYEKDKEFIRAKLARPSVPLDKLLKAAGLSSTPAADARPISQISMDSSRTVPGSLFVGIPGYVKNGADFSGSAIDHGAAAIVAPIDYKFDSATDAKIGEKSIPVARADNPRIAFSDLAYAFYGSKQPDTIVALTGTSGKSSTADFVRQMWALLGEKTLSSGTLGTIVDNVYSGQKTIKYNDDHTTPTGDELFRDMAYFKDRGVEHAVLEMSSHGIDQQRAKNFKIKAAGFTNFGNDHVDFYGSSEKYFAAKSRLFSEMLDAGGTAVLNADIPEFAPLKAICDARGIKVISYGRAANADIKILSQDTSLFGQTATIEIFGEKFDLKLAILGGYQLMNLLCALGLFISVEKDWKKIMPLLPQLKNAAGRLEYMGETKKGAHVFVDFSYKGDALEHTLKTLREVARGKIISVFSTCGDNYETRIRRAELGPAAAKYADVKIITDDSPRTEDPAKIRAEVAANCPGATEVPGRENAIRRAIEIATKDDIILISGKGHEDYITIGHTDIPYTDQETARKILAE